MAKPEWGEKHRCTSCGKPFYDMQRDPITCPSCGAEHVPEKLLKPAKPAPAAKKEVKKEVAEGEESDILLDDEEILAEDDVDLPDDEDGGDQIGVVVSVSDEEDM